MAREIYSLNHNAINMKLFIMRIPFVFYFLFNLSYFGYAQCNPSEIFNNDSTHAACFEQNNTVIPIIFQIMIMAHLEEVTQYKVKILNIICAYTHN